MNQHYFPVVRAKKGEFDAFKKLSKAALSRCTPVLEIPKPSQDDLKRASDKSSTPYEYWLEDRADKIVKAFKGRTIFLDASQWATGFTTEGGSQVLPFVKSRISSRGVVVCPVIGYDRWDSVQYKQAIKNISLENLESYCIRLDDLALEDIVDIDNFESIIDSISLSLGVNNNEISVIVDIGDVTGLSVLEIIEILESTCPVLESLGFKKIIMTGSSIPDSIEKAVKDRDSSDVIDRKEMLAWKGFIAANPNSSLCFGDYGVRNPRSSDIIAPDMNVKIRYTIENAFFIVRGHSVRGEHGYAQSNLLSSKIVNSKYYMGSDFSWGDARVFDCSNGLFIGNSTDWIAIDTNHHMMSVVSEIFEFATEIAAANSGRGATV